MSVTYTTVVYTTVVSIVDLWSIHDGRVRNINLIFRPHRLYNVYVNAPYCYRPSSVSVGRFVTLVSPAKTAALIERPFGLRTQVGSGNHVLDWRSDPHGKGQFWGKRTPIAK